MGYRVAVVGATGSVGREMLNILEERQFPITEVTALASKRSAGRQVSFGDKTLTIVALDDFDFTGYDFALFSAGGSISEKFAPIAAKQGCIVIDNSSHFRMDPDVPLIVPEVNPQDAAGYTKKNIIANPNCSTAQLVLALKPLHDKAKIKRVVVSTYQSTSGAGGDGMDELFNQTKGMFVHDEATPSIFTKQIAFNVIPHIDAFLDDRYTKEEWKMVVETKKIVDATIKLTATCVRVPTFVGHAESVNIEFENPLSGDEARELLREAPGILVVDNPEENGYVTPVECVGDYATFVSRIRDDATLENAINLWCVSDNLRKGAALNTVQIAELVGREYLKKAA